MPLVDHHPREGDGELARRWARTAAGLDAVRPGTIARDVLGRRWVKQHHPYAVPFLADWRCTERAPDQLWATSRQLVEVLAE